VSGYYQGANGGSGVVILRYSVRGSGAGSAEPVVTIAGAAYNAGDFAADVAYRVAWAGEGHDTADVKIAWGYSPTHLIHTNDVASAVIGTGACSVPLLADKCTIYLRAVAVNAGGHVGASDRVLSLYVEENEKATGETGTPTLADVGLLSVDGLYAVVTGVVTSVGTTDGATEACTLRVKVGTSENNLASAGEGSFALGAFTLAATNLAINTTYYYAVEAEDSAGNVFMTDTGSFTTVGQSLLGDVAAAVNRRQYTVSGALSTVGAGTTYVLVKWDDGDWQEVKTFQPSSTDLSFSTVFDGSWDASSAWTIMVSNACLNADGSLPETPQVWTGATSDTCTAIDNTIYTWQAVDGDWNGAWSVTNHWRPNIADCKGFPQTSNATASFADCTLENPVQVEVDGNYTVGKINLFDGDAADLSFVGTGAAASSLKSSNAKPDFKDRYMRGNSRLSFKDIMLDASGQELDFAQPEDNTATGMEIIFSGATVKAKNIWLRADGSTLSFRDGTAVTLTDKMSVAGVNTIVTIDDSTVTTPSVYAGDNRDSTGFKLRFEGVAPRLSATTQFQTYNRADEILLEFAVPVGGYSAAPINKTGAAFATAISGQTPGTFTFAVAEDSPALRRSSEQLSNQVLVQTQSGFVPERIVEGIGTVPEHDGASCGSFKYGLNGAALEEGDDPSTARQVLLDLKGYGTSGILFLVY
ncbi:MAG: hypothetical protein IJ829_00900, partial [Kiritimatiellae bacterium]|nr:hypothetical protein [Kiritimatiellia bacterium]